MRRLPSYLSVPATLSVVASAMLQAGSFRVSPVRIDLSARHLHTTLQVANIGADRVTLQVDAYSWRMSDGDDQLVETEDILINPPVFTLEPGANQVLRLGLREWIPGNMEQSYRLILEEVPPSQRSGVNGVVTLLRVSVPIFVQTTQHAAADLVWSAIRQTEERTVLRLENRGTQHARLSQFQVIAEDKTALQVAMPTYILPGTRREWIIEGTRIPPSGELRILGKTEDSEVNVKTTVVGLR